MDASQKLWYEKDFKIAFLSTKGDAFQGFFETLMSKAHPNDFLACRPWGNIGDRKNDGYLRSSNTLYQVYAPNELNANDAIKKINEDFEGAKPHWGAYVQEWTFVHNAPNGRLPPQVIDALLKLQKANPQIKINSYGYEELLTEFRRLKLSDLESWFGLSPTQNDNLNLGFEDLNAVLQHISINPVPIPSEVKDVSKGKIEANLLSSAVADFLKLGMQRSFLVEQFFNNFNKPVYGEQIAHAFTEKYAALQKEIPRLPPDVMFSKIEEWATGTANKTPQHKAAVLAVMAYMFDKCEIFEDAQTVRTS